MKAKTARILKWLPVLITAIAAALVAPAVIARLVQELRPGPSVADQAADRSVPAATPVAEEQPH